MRCSKARQFLMEYIDGELCQTLQRRIAEHLRNCRGCAEAEKELRTTAIEPFRKAEKYTVPETVWQKIKERITVSQPRIWPVRPVKEFPALLFRKPVLVATAVCLLFLAVSAGVHIRGQYVVRAYLQEQAEFLSYLAGENGQGYPEPDGLNGLDLGTAIEKYLL